MWQIPVLPTWEGLGLGFLSFGQDESQEFDARDVAPAQRDRDLSGPTQRGDAANPRVHGTYRGPSLLGAEPLPMVIAGDGTQGFNAPTREMIGTVYRQQRAPQLQHFPFEPSISIRSISKQSYNYQKNDTPNPFIERAQEVIQIESTIRPALEPPRNDYLAQDLTEIQDRDDEMFFAAQMRQMGMR